MVTGLAFSPRIHCCFLELAQGRGDGPDFILRKDLLFDHFVAETLGQLPNFSDPVSSVGNMGIGLLQICWEVFRLRGD